MMRKAWQRYFWYRQDQFVYLWGEKAGPVRMRQTNRLQVLGLFASLVSFPAGRFAGNSFSLCVFLFLLILFLVLFAPEWFLRKQLRWRRYALERELPDLLDRIAMLLSAGLTLPLALERASAYAEEDTPLSFALAQRLRGQVAGSGVVQGMEAVLMDLAVRCRSPAVSMSVSYLIQSMQKGSGELAEQLRQQAQQQRSERKHLARKQGEEASNLLLFPTILVFAAILLMLVAPAILDLSI